MRVNCYLWMWNGSQGSSTTGKGKGNKIVKKRKGLFIPTWE
jgi:hypothetical protein